MNISTGDEYLNQKSQIILQDNFKYTTTYFATEFQYLLYIYNAQFIIETFLMIFKNLSCPSIL